MSMGISTEFVSHHHVFSSMQNQDYFVSFVCLLACVFPCDMKVWVANSSLFLLPRGDTEGWVANLFLFPLDTEVCVANFS